MAIASDRKKLLYKIAKSYYEDGLTQGEIGKRFGISRIKVSRLLQQARAEKLVQITITSQESSNADLERELEAKYGLDEAVIVSASSNDKITTTRELGPAAVECLLRCLQGNEVLSVSWGSTLLSVVDSLPIKPWPEIRNRIFIAYNGVGNLSSSVNSGICASCADYIYHLSVKDP
jgi:DNA-binding transcriptional regulator LsrR (DeoR family)